MPYLEKAILLCRNELLEPRFVRNFKCHESQEQKSTVYKNFQYMNRTETITTSIFFKAVSSIM